MYFLHFKFLKHSFWKNYCSSEWLKLSRGNFVIFAAISSKHSVANFHLKNVLHEINDELCWKILTITESHWSRKLFAYLGLYYLEIISNYHLSTEIVAPLITSFFCECKKIKHPRTTNNNCDWNLDAQTLVTRQQRCERPLRGCLFSTSQAASYAASCAASLRGYTFVSLYLTSIESAEPTETNHPHL